MVFKYYSRLTPAEQRAYRRSDTIAAIRLPMAEPLRAMAAELSEALKKEDRDRTEALAQELVTGITDRLQVPTVRIEVLEVRPSSHWGELHGLYRPAERERRPRVTLWMRTAKRRQVVAFRTFLRTLVHELCHHLDYELLSLRDSFHTEGFYKRESSLVHQLLPMRNESLPLASDKTSGEEPATGSASPA